MSAIDLPAVSKRSSSNSLTENELGVKSILLAVACDSTKYRSTTPALGTERGKLLTSRNPCRWNTSS